MFEISDYSFTELIDPNAKLELVADGFKFTEGPVWHTQENCLYFSDIPSDTIYKFDNKNWHFNLSKTQ